MWVWFITCLNTFACAQVHVHATTCLFWTGLIYLPESDLFIWMRMFPVVHHREFPYAQGNPHYAPGIFFLSWYTNQYFLKTTLILSYRHKQTHTHTHTHTHKPWFRPPLFLEGKVNFDYLPWRGEFEKLKKQLVLFLFNFLRFIIFTFTNYFTLCKIVLYIWRKIIFSTTIILWKKVTLICLKMNLKISHKLQ